MHRGTSAASYTDCAPTEVWFDWAPRCRHRGLALGRGCALSRDSGTWTAVGIGGKSNSVRVTYLGARGESRDAGPLPDAPQVSLGRGWRLGRGAALGAGECAGSQIDVGFDVERIDAILSQDHYAAIWVGGREILSDESLDRLALRLDGTQFVRVHRGALINLNCLSELEQEGDRKYVARGVGCPTLGVSVSRDRLDDLRRRLGLA